MIGPIPKNDKEKKIYEKAIGIYRESISGKSLGNDERALSSLSKQFAEHKLNIYRKYGYREEILD